VSIDVDGKPYLAVADTLITSSDPDHWRFIDLKLMQGKALSVKIEGPGAAAIDLVKVSDTIPGKYPLYHEPGRPKVHFSPPRGSLNDPCGMIYYEGQWHMYYAAKRFSNSDMGNPNSMWGHATSTDLLHWEEQPIFLPAVEGEYSFWTGGAAVDVENTTGLGRPGKPAIVYSANNGGWGASYTQCIFVSTDGGMTALWNPEMMYKPLPKEDARRGGGTRDPMILWWAPEKKWVMVVHNDPTGNKGGFYFFESGDLKNWTETSVLEDQLECPNLFSLPVDGNKENMRWVVFGSQNPYQIGKFDGKAFVPDDKNNTKIRAHFGQFSSSQVFANAPGGRIVQVGWAHCCWYETEFSQMAAFPLELSLRTTPEGVRMYQAFIPELAELRNQGSKQKDAVVKAGTPLKVGDVSQPAEIVAEFDPGSASQVTFTGAELNISWSALNQELEVNGERINRSPKDGSVALHILLDIPSVEVVTGAGDYIIKGRDYRKLGEKSPMEIRAEGGDVQFSRLEFHPLKSIHGDRL
jgi:fructan beta-fructosidase